MIPSKIKFPSYMGWMSIFLTTLFLGLKLANIISWIWGWVVSPFWIYICLVVLEDMFWTFAGYIYAWKFGGNEKEDEE